MKQPKFKKIAALTAMACMTSSLSSSWADNAPAQGGTPAAPAKGAPSFVIDKQTFTPPEDQGCAYTQLIQGLGGNASKQNTANSTTTPGLSVTDIKNQEVQRLTAEQQANTLSRNQNRVRLDTEKSNLQRELSQLQSASDSSASATRITEIQTRIVAIDFERSQIDQQEKLDQTYYDQQKFTLQQGDALQSPYLNIMMKSTDSALDKQTLTPLTRDLMGYAGYAYAGPAGLIVGSSVGAMMGGAIDILVAAVKKLLLEPEASIEDLIPLLQDVCRWREANSKATKALLDQNEKERRQKSKAEMLALIDRTEEDLKTCHARASEMNQEIEKLSLSLEILTSRIQQGKVNIRGDLQQVADLNIPAHIVQRLERIENMSVSALVQELQRAKLENAEFIDRYNDDAVRKNQASLQQLRTVVQSTMAIDAPGETDSSRIEMILMASNNRLRSVELGLQRKLMDVLVHEKNSAADETKLNYRKDSVALSAALIEIELNYLRAMNQLHERAIALQDETAQGQGKMYKKLLAELDRSKDLQSRSPLLYRTDASGLNDIRAPSDAPPGQAIGNQACTQKEIEKSCYTATLFKVTFCTCPADS